MPLEVEDFGVLAVEAAREALPKKLEGISALQPSGMDTVTGAVNLATRHALQAQVDVASRGLAGKLGGKISGRLSFQSEDFAKGPTVGGPIRRGDECGFLPKIS